jgi:hypothetical protein
MQWKIGISTVAYRWYEKAGLRRDALSSQVIDALKGAADKETGGEEDYHQNNRSDKHAAGSAVDDRSRRWG